MRQLLFMLSLLWVFCSTALAAVNINTASQGELETLPGIGPSKASAIIEYRTENGAFTAVSQLDNVPGIGPATLSNLSSMITLGDRAATPPTPDATEPGSAPAPTISPDGPAGKIDVNSASQSELEGLPGIGPTKADAIIAYRTANGAFASCSDLARVDGIGPATVSSLRDSCIAGQ